MIGKIRIFEVKPTGNCGALGMGIGQLHIIECELPAGHRGPHSCKGHEWDIHQEVEPPAPAEEALLRIYLASDGLLSKWGFEDGDVLENVLFKEHESWDRFYNDADLLTGHEELIRLVKTCLVPEIEMHHKLDVFEVEETNHNPIRTRSVDGVEVDVYHAQSTVTLTPEGVLLQAVPTASGWVVKGCVAVERKPEIATT